MTLGVTLFNEVPKTFSNGPTIDSLPEEQVDLCAVTVWVLLVTEL